MDELGLHNASREKLLQTDNGLVALFFDALILAGFKAGDCITVRQVMANFAVEGINLTQYAIYKALDQARSLGLLAWKTVNERKRGRPVTVYRLSPMNLIAQKLGVICGIIDNIGKAAVSSLRNYRSHLTHAFIQRRPGIYPRKWLGARFGVGGRATYNYQQDFDDIEVKSQFIATPITWDNLDSLPREAQQGPVFLRVYVEVPLTAEEIAARHSWVNPISQPLLVKTRTEERKFPAVRGIAAKLLKQGHDVFHVKQTANHYRVKSEYDAFINIEEQPMKPEPEVTEPHNPNLDTLITNRYAGDKGITAAAAWSATYNQLELQVDRNTFDSFIREAELLDYVDDTFIVAAPTTIARDMLQYRHIRLITRILSDVTGTQAQIQFISDTQPQSQLARFAK